MPAHRRRGPVDDAVVLPERRGDRRAVRRPHEDPAGAGADLLEEEGREARGGQPPTTRSSAPGSIARSPSGRRTSCSGPRRRASRSTSTCPTRRCTTRRFPTRSTPARPSAGTGATSSPRWTTSPAWCSTSSTSSGSRTTRSSIWSSDNGADTTYHYPAIDPDPVGGSGTGSPVRGAAACSPPSRGRTGRRASSGGRGRCPQGGSATSSCTWSTGTRRC